MYNRGIKLLVLRSRLESEPALPVLENVALVKIS